MKKKYIYFLSLLAVATVCILYALTQCSHMHMTRQPFNIAIIHAGEPQDAAALFAARLAIEQVNNSGGVLGRMLHAHEIKEDQDIRATLEDLIKNKEIVACIAISPLKAKKEIQDLITKHNNCLLYVASSLGLEEPSNTIFLGAIPNISIIPATTWAITTFGKSCFFIGSDDAFAHGAYEMVKQQVALLGAELKGYQFIDAPSFDIKQFAAHVQDTKPDIIFHAIAINAYDTFFKDLKQVGITAAHMPMLSFTIDEVQLKKMPDFVGNYIVANYLATIDRAQNRSFIKKIGEYSADAPVTNTVECAYNAVHVWARSVQTSGSIHFDALLNTMKVQMFNGPGSIIYIDDNHYAWRPILIGKALYTGQYSIVWNSNDAVHPEPFPPYKNKQEWKDFAQTILAKGNV
jgi:urea transport system substrate-binding protein